MNMVSAPESVYVLWHLRKEDDDEPLLIGVYRKEEDAKEAIERLSKRPGFVTVKNGFKYDKYEINRDYWSDGYVLI
jgi:hypothetical protein